MPPNTVYVGRPTIYGNIFSWRRWGRKKAVSLYRRWLRGRIPLREMIRLVGGSHVMLLNLALLRQKLLRDWIPRLRKKNLCCWCPLPKQGQPDLCHRSVLLEIANG
jgi:hypothetical protein